MTQPINHPNTMENGILDISKAEICGSPRRSRFTRDDIAVWPNGDWEYLETAWDGVDRGESDDFECVSSNDTKRLEELGIDLE